MMALLLVLGVAAIVLLIYLEGKRQERMLGEKASGQPNLVGNAMLEAQGILEPERKVETMQEALVNEDRIEVEHDQEAGDADPDENVS